MIGWHRHNKYKRGRIMQCFLAALCLLVTNLGWTEQNITVVFPDVPQPYVRIFDEIISGIEAAHDAPVEKYLLNEASNAEELESWLERANSRDVIALGSQAMSLVTALPDDYRRVIGAVIKPPKENGKNLSAITMAPDPDLLFEKLTEIADGVNEVTVIYSIEDHAQQIARAQQVASNHGITLNAIPKNNSTSQGATAYKELFAKGKPKVQALWLLQGDKALQSRSVFYNLLKDVWNNNVLMFTSNPSHVTKGALFTLYQDNVALGEKLTEELEKLRSGKKGEILNTRSVLIAVNVRTAEHLEIKFTRAQERGFDLIFPPR